MNMDTDLVNRALFAAGRKPMKDDGTAESKAIRDLCRGMYLQTFLEALSEVPWTGGKRRKRLMRVRDPHESAGYAFAYHLPMDCARPVELLDRGMFVVEGGFLHTDTEGAELLYVTNGKGFPEFAALEAPRIGEHCDTVLSSGMVGEWDIPTDLELCAGGPWDIEWHGERVFPDGTVEPAHMPEGWNFEDPDSNDPVPLPADPVPTDDYPGYRPPRYEPKFYEYVEKMMAAKLASGNEKQPRLHASLLQEALLIKRDAEFASRSIATARQQPKEWWTERMFKRR